MHQPDFPFHVDDLARFQFNDKESKKQTEEEVRDLQKNRRPTPLPHDYAETSSSSVPSVLCGELGSCISEWSVYSLGYPALGVPHGCALLPRGDYLPHRHDEL